MTLPQIGFTALLNMAHTDVTGSSGNVAAAVATASLPAVANKTNYLTGFDITGSGATAGLPVTVTVTGCGSGTLSYTYSAAVGALVENFPLFVSLDYPIAATSSNTAITISCPSLGTGNTNNTVNIYGFLV